jgi:hypothetical protein
MINNQYLIDCSDWSDEGGSCQVYPIKNQSNLVFKEFKNKKKAIAAHSIQKKLSRFDLAPKIYTEICKLKFAYHNDIYFDDPSNWGFVTELATLYDPATEISMRDIQNLVNDIEFKTGLKFWDCHWYNVGTVKRGRKKKVVCIDTGKESFNGISNAWGNPDPGPKCSYCRRYKCKCFA